MAQEYYNVLKIKYFKLVLKIFTIENIIEVSEDDKGIILEIKKISKNVTYVIY